jgi:chromosome partitioning protein
MRKVLIASSKGGCGKSTIATNLAAYYANRGKRTVLVDADRQGSSQRWGEKRSDMEHAVLAIPNQRRDWYRSVPDDAEQVIVDSAAGVSAADVGDYLDHVDAVIVPVLPSAMDLEAAAPFLKEVSRLSPVRRGKVPVGLVANRLRPWTHASQRALEEMKEFPFPVIAQLRDTQAYVLTTALGKSIFDYGSELVRSHQEDWAKLLRWLKRQS